MIDNNYIQVALGLLRIISKTVGYRISRDEMWKIEKGLINLANKYNGLINFFVNSKFSNWLKEFGYNLFGVPYPEFMYSDQLEQYIARLPEKPKIGEEIEIELCDISTYAQDFSHLNYFKKKKLLKLVNQTFDKMTVFRYRRILEYK